MSRIFQNLRRLYLKKKLKDKDWEWLYEPYNGDEIVSFDCETTGLNPKKDEILTIGAVIIKNNSILTSQKFEIKLKPNIDLCENSVKVHHLRHRDLECGCSQEDGVRHFLEFAGNRTLLGYYAEFDVALVNRVFRKICGSFLPNRIIEISSIYHDTKQKIIPDANIDLSYGAILKELKIPSIARHSAIGDAITSALIWLALKKL